MPALTNNQDAEVRISEQGRLTINRVAMELTGTGAVITDLVVPVGERWILKGLSTNKSSGTYTIGAIRPIIILATSSEVFEFPNDTIEINATYGEQNLILEAGDTLRTNITVSAFTTTGNYYIYWMYQRMDA